MADGGTLRAARTKVSSVVEGVGSHRKTVIRLLFSDIGKDEGWMLVLSDPALPLTKD